MQEQYGLLKNFPVKFFFKRGLRKGIKRSIFIIDLIKKAPEFLLNQTG